MTTWQSAGQHADGHLIKSDPRVCRFVCVSACPDPNVPLRTEPEAAKLLADQLPEAWWRLFPQSFASFHTPWEESITNSRTRHSTQAVSHCWAHFALSFMSSRRRKPHFPPVDLLSMMLFNFESRFSLPDFFLIWQKQNYLFWLFFTEILLSIITSTRQLLTIGWLAVAASLMSQLAKNRHIHLTKILRPPFWYCTQI